MPSVSVTLHLSLQLMAGEMRCDIEICQPLESEKGI